MVPIRKKKATKMVPPPPPPPPPAALPLDPKMWGAYAKGLAVVHTLNSRVYYFPQGHMGEASSPPESLSALLLSTPAVLCSVAAAQFFADSKSDELFAKLTLHPIVGFPAVPVPNPASSTAAGDDASASAASDDDAILSCTIALTQRDINGGEGLFLSRRCCDPVFPAFDLGEPAVDLSDVMRMVKVTDVQGKTWEFRQKFKRFRNHYRLTLGWKEFVKEKNLVAGDLLSFVKSSNGLSIGIRRAKYFFPSGKLSPVSVAKAAELAAEGKPFEVVYYPKCGRWRDFVVKAEIVDEATRVGWSPGMEVKIPAQVRDSFFGYGWYYGTVSSINASGPWQGSPWLMLEITWQNPTLFEHLKWVSPWQVKLVTAPLSTSTPLHFICQ